MKIIALKLYITIGFLFYITSAYANDPSYYRLSHIKTPSAGLSQSIGSYANGCLAGAITLPKNGDGYQLMRLSRNRYYVHSDLYHFITNFAKQVQISHPFNGILVGDTGGAIGGPMPSGHSSHQTGLDVDIWLKPNYPYILSDNERETLSSISHVTPQQTMRDSWDKSYTDFVLMAARNHNVSRIFVNPAIKRRICEQTDWQKNLHALAKIRPWYGHDSHMHVRLKCPSNNSACVDQAPPVQHHGCTGNDIDWWFTPEALNPKPSTTVPYKKTFFDLPAECQELYKNISQ